MENINWVRLGINQTAHRVQRNIKYSVRSVTPFIEVSVHRTCLSEIAFCCGRYFSPMGVCLFANCSSDQRDKSISFFRLPLARDRKLAKQWFIRSKRADLRFENLKDTSGYVVCSKHFNPNQLSSYSYARSTRVRPKPGEIPQAMESKKKKPRRCLTVGLSDTYCYSTGLIIYSNTNSINRKLMIELLNLINFVVEAWEKFIVIICCWLIHKHPFLLIKWINL